MKDKRYRCSDARNEAIKRISALRSGAIAASRKKIPTIVRDMTYQSAIFQASSTLEEYVKQIFDHWLFELKKRALIGNNIPSRARLSYIGRELNDDFSRYLHTKDERFLAEKLQTRLELLKFAIGDAPIPTYLKGEFIYKDRKYPSPKNLRQLYVRIGCDDIFNRLSEDLKTDAEMKLTGFNDIRSTIAHGDPPDLTLEDVKRNLDIIASFIRSLDKINHREFSRDFEGGVW